MTKQFLYTTLGILLFVPLYSHAEESPLALATTSKEAIVEVIASSSPEEVPSKNFTTCSQEAIENRDTRIAASRSLYNSAMANALNDRKNREKTAITIKHEDDKKTAIKSSAQIYKNLVKSAQNTLTQARKDAWQTFEDDIENCRTLQNNDQELKNMTEDDNETPQIEEPALRKSVQASKKSDDGEPKGILETLRSLFN